MTLGMIYVLAGVNCGALIAIIVVLFLLLKINRQLEAERLVNRYRLAEVVARSGDAPEGWTDGAIAELLLDANIEAFGEEHVG